MHKKNREYESCATKIEYKYFASEDQCEQEYWKFVLNYESTSTTSLLLDIFDNKAEIRLNVHKCFSSLN